MTKEEAINKVRQMSLPKETLEILEAIAPELQESEDERVRKELIEFVEEYGDKFYGQITKLNTIAWLEKQKTVSAIPDDLVKCYKEFCEKVGRETAALINAINYCNTLEKQKEQKPAEWSEDYREEGIQTRFAFYTYKDDSSVLYLSNIFVEESSRNEGLGTKILAAAEKVAETIGAITIRLKVKQNSPANAWYRKHGYDYVTFEDGYDWLEKNLEYMKSNKQEWSEEDKRKLNMLFSTVSQAADAHAFFCTTRLIGDGEAIELHDFLKSLRPQPHWKPSALQMVALKNAAFGAVVNGDSPYLRQLYNELKKL